MAETLIGTHNAAVARRLWVDGITQAHDIVVVMDKIVNVRKKKFLFAQIESFPILPTNTANDVGSGGTISPTADTVTDRQITVNVEKEASIDIRKSAVDLSMPETSRAYQANLGHRIAKSKDLEMLSNDASWTASSPGLGSAASPVAFTEGAVRLAVEAIEAANTPRINRYGVIHSKNWTELVDSDRVGNAAALGATLANNPIVRGVRPDGRTGLFLSGVEIVVSNNVPLSGTTSRRCQVFHGPDMALAMNNEITFEKTSQTAAKLVMWLFLSTALWGDGVIQTGAGVVVYSTP